MLVFALKIWKIQILSIQKSIFQSTLLAITTLPFLIVSNKLQTKIICVNVRIFHFLFCENFIIYIIVLPARYEFKISQSFVFYFTTSIHQGFYRHAILLIPITYILLYALKNLHRIIMFSCRNKE